MIPARIGSVTDDPELLALIVVTKAERASARNMRLVLWVEGKDVCCSVDATYRAAYVLEHKPNWIVGVYKQEISAYSEPPGQRKRRSKRTHWHLDDGPVQDDLREFLGLVKAA